MTGVVVINGSAKMGKGNTALVLAPFLDGMREAGASVELFYAKRLNIKPCTGEFYCWNKKPGECYIDERALERLSPFPLILLV